MNDEYRPNGLGCGWWLVAGGLFVLLMMAGGRQSSEDTTPSNNNRSGTLSGNQVEVMSRNQLNLWSDVQNCYGDWSCVTIITTTTSSVQNTTTVNGDRNVVIGSDGARLCEDPQTHIYTTAACQ